jgi:hypothetical protein
MMKRKGEVTQSITFDECIALVACPYCHVPKGDNCRRIGHAILDYPHKSRAREALKVRAAIGTASKSIATLSA